jgi:hypothetical protein
MRSDDDAERWESEAYCGLEYGCISKVSTNLSAFRAYSIYE